MVPLDGVLGFLFPTRFPVSAFFGMIFLSCMDFVLRTVFSLILFESPDSVFLTEFRSGRSRFPDSACLLDFQRRSFLPPALSIVTSLAAGLTGCWRLDSLVFPRLLTDSGLKADLETFRAFN